MYQSFFQDSSSENKYKNRKRERKQVGNMKATDQLFFHEYFVLHYADTIVLCQPQNILKAFELNIKTAGKIF